TLNARNAFARTNPPFTQYQYGFTFGGPIIKDKTFFFVSLERLTIDATNFVTISDQAIASLNRMGFPTQNGDVPFEQRTTPLLISLRNQFGARDTLTLRYNFSRGIDENIMPFGGLVAKTEGGIGLLRDDAFAVTNTAIINPRLFIESRF